MSGSLMRLVQGVVEKCSSPHPEQTRWDGGSHEDLRTGYMPDAVTVRRPHMEWQWLCQWQWQ